MKDGFYWYKDPHGIWVDAGQWCVVEVQNRTYGLTAFCGEESKPVSEMPGEFRYIEKPVD